MLQLLVELINIVEPESLFGMIMCADDVFALICGNFIGIGAEIVYLLYIFTMKIPLQFFDLQKTALILDPEAVLMPPRR